MFAKLYETEVGQVLVKLGDHPDHGAEVRVYFELEQLGLCDVLFNWPDDEDYIQWEKAEDLFEKVDDEWVSSFVNDQLGLEQ